MDICADSFLSFLLLGECFVPLSYPLHMGILFLGLYYCKFRFVDTRSSSADFSDDCLVSISEIIRNGYFPQ